MGHPGLFLFIFGLFKQTIQFLHQIDVKNCPSSTQRGYMNSHPLKHESSPKTTRPGLPPIIKSIFVLQKIVCLCDGVIVSNCSCFHFQAP